MAEARYALPDDEIEVVHAPEPGGAGGLYRALGETLRGLKTTMARLFEGPSAVDVIVTPTTAANLTQLVATNLTGHPAVILPHGFREDGTPSSLTFLGALYGEAAMLRVAAAYQGATDFHLRRPPGFA